MIGVRQQIVVGLDGSPESLTAVRWAAKEAELRRLSVLLVHAFTLPVVGAMGYTIPTTLADGLHDAGEQILEGVAQELRESHPGLDVAGKLVEADPRPVLVEASERAGLTVVGTRGGGRIPEVILGSVALHISAHGRSPVAVIPAGAAPDAGGPVLLGVDGSRTSEAAVEFAFDEADRRGAPLRAVLVWDDVALRGLARVEPLVRLEDEEEHAVLAEQLAGWRAKYPDVTVQQEVRRGRAAEALLRRQSGGPAPQLVVVGSRGRGGFAGLLLGSTSHSLIGHSHWPVVVVRRVDH
jgi:nucleotide-binding universal stress UspA family protein